MGFIGALAQSACGSSGSPAGSPGHGGGGHAGGGSAGASAGGGGGTAGAAGGGTDGGAGANTDGGAGADGGSADSVVTNPDGGGLDVPAEGGAGVDGPSSPAGAPLPLCTRTTDCAQGSSCVPYVWPDLYLPSTYSCPLSGTCEGQWVSTLGEGHCIPDGEAGGFCRATGSACDSGLGCDPLTLNDHDKCGCPIFGSFDTHGIEVDTPVRRCAPLVKGGAACGYDLVCDGHCNGPSIPAAAPGTCIGPGMLNGDCRATSPRCDTGLGCTAAVGGTCQTLATGECAFLGCADGFNCSFYSTLCVAAGSAGGTCRSTTPQCDPGLYCGSDQRAGMPAPNLGYCVTGFTGLCAPGRCPTGQSCTPTQTCAADGEAGGTCLAGSTCAKNGLACVNNNTCQFVGDGGSCTASSLCKVGSECSAGHVCTPFGGVGTACGTSANAHPCSTGLFCSAQGTCADPAQALAEGAPCGSLDVCGPGMKCAFTTSASTGTCRTMGAAGGACRPPVQGSGSTPCDAGLGCWPAPSSYSTCQPETLTAGAACSTDRSAATHCQRGLSCINKVCAVACRLHDPNGACDPGFACSSTSGSCVPGLPAGARCAGPDVQAACAVPNFCRKVGPDEAYASYQCAPAGYVEEVVATLPFIDACASGNHVTLEAGFQFTNVDARFAGHAKPNVQPQFPPPPFPILFWGLNVHFIVPSTKGFLTIDGISADVGIGNGYLPTGSFASAISAGLKPSTGAYGVGAAIAPFWDDLLLGEPPTSDICTTVTGAAPARKLVVEWAHAKRYGVAGSDLDFEVVFNETTNVIELAYKTLAPATGANAAWADGSRASIGLQSGYNGVAIRHEGAVVAGSGLRYTPR